MLWKNSELATVKNLLNEEQIKVAEDFFTLSLEKYKCSEAFNKNEELTKLSYILHSYHENETKAELMNLPEFIALEALNVALNKS